jgi:EpsI family protein
MRMRLNAMLPALILGVGCLGLLRNQVQRRVPLDEPLSTILPSVEGFSTRDQTVSDEERAVAGMTEFVARTYSRNDTIAFSTLVSYYDRQTQGRSIHSPRNCLPGAGWEVLALGQKELDVDGQKYVVNQYTLKNGLQSAVVYYWYQGRGRVVASEYAVKWNLLRDAALTGHTEEALVRVVVPVRSTASTAASETAKNAADSLGYAVATRLLRDVKRSLPGFEG